MNSSWLKTLIDNLSAKKFIIIFASLMVLFVPLAAVSTIDEKHEGYLAMTTLGSDMKTTNYFANGNGTLGIGEQASWYVKVHNGMGSAEYVSLRIKLLNSSQLADPHYQNQSSSERTIFELRQLVSKNGTWTAPLNWSIGSVETKDSYLAIRSLKINGQEVSNLDVRNINGQGFRMVLELWRYNSNIEDFESSWPSSTFETRSVWNQIWFNVRN